MRRALAPIAALVLVLGTVGNAAASSEASSDHAKLYYVSVGDSQAAGVQPIGDPDNLYRTLDGYSEQLLAIGRERLPKLSLIKLGCPGETTATMIGGGICSYPHGSQLDEAVSFLHAHRNHVAFVTIDLGANDFPCNEVRCVPAGIASIRANVPGILAVLREAAGPDVPIVGATLYNPFLAAWLLGPEGRAYAEYTETALIGPIDAMLCEVFQAAGADVADANARAIPHGSQLDSPVSETSFRAEIGLGDPHEPVPAKRVLGHGFGPAPAGRSRTGAGFG